MKCVLVHYSEIGIKGGNRRFFEKKLVENIASSLNGRWDPGCTSNKTGKSASKIKNVIKGQIERKRGRIIVRTGVKNINLLTKIAGISSFSIAEETQLALPKLKKIVINIAKRSKKKTFRISASRANKSFPHTSMQLNALLGEAVLKATKMKVDLHKPEIEIFVEIADKAYVYGEKIQGIGGLPVGTAGKLVCLLSGGIDSPAAAYKMMTRGCRVVFVHFHNHDPFMSKIKHLVETLSTYQGRSTLYLIPFKDLQQQIIKKTEPKYRMLLYRRLMMQLAEQIARKEHAHGLITGDSVAQVASQTLHNLNVIYEPVSMPIFSPLIGTHKQDIINEAQKIGTYKTSIIPYTDCCSVLIGKHPETHGKIKDIKKLEKKLRIKALMKKALEKAETEKI